MAFAGSEATPIVRPAWNDMVLIKRYLDIGAQTLLLSIDTIAPAALLSPVGPAVKTTAQASDRRSIVRIAGCRKVSACLPGTKQTTRPLPRSVVQSTGDTP